LDAWIRLYERDFASYFPLICLNIQAFVKALERTEPNYARRFAAEQYPTCFAGRQRTDSRTRQWQTTTKQSYLVSRLPKGRQPDWDLAKHHLHQHGNTEKPNQVQDFKATKDKESNLWMLGIYASAVKANASKPWTITKPKPAFKHTKNSMKPATKREA
jgi:hypothetical protein